MHNLEMPEKLWRGEVTVIGYSNKALRMDHENKEAWIPLSLIHEDSEVNSAVQLYETGELMIPEWLARKKGWV